jgi:hypothetical protein
LPAERVWSEYPVVSRKAQHTTPVPPPKLNRGEATLAHLQTRRFFATFAVG